MNTKWLLPIVLLAILGCLLVFRLQKAGVFSSATNASKPSASTNGIGDTHNIVFTNFVSHAQFLVKPASPFVYSEDILFMLSVTNSIGSFITLTSNNIVTLYGQDSNSVWSVDISRDLVDARPTSMQQAGGDMWVFGDLKSLIDRYPLNNARIIIDLTNGESGLWSQ